MREMMEDKAENYYGQGYNCCQSVLLAANDIWHLDISQDVIDAAAVMREGMASGCACGALVGMEMALGLMVKKRGLTLKKDHVRALHDSFVQNFGSTCCRVLRKKQGLVERTSQKGCRGITARSAGILYDLVKGLPERDKGITAPWNQWLKNR